DYEEVKSAVSDLRKKGKDVLAKVKERYFAEPLEEQIALIRKTYPSAKFLKELLLGFHQAYGEKKREKNLVDFNDIEHFAIEILKNKEAAAEYREKFQYIFIDEYQDSNYLQEEIINQIKRENNLFMVGDIKQSIYRFRLAEPGIFKEKYERYKKSGKQSVKFDLNENFRSKKSIIDGVNDIFSGLMEDYTPEVALHLGRNDPRDIHYPVELHLVNGATELDEEIDETLLEMKKNELEALAACKLIEDAVGELFYDHKAEVERRLTKRDIVILMRGVKNTADIFYDVLKANNIQAYIDDNSGYFDTIEILTFLDLLRVINNKNQDIPLLSVLRSAIFGFTIDELIQIRLEHREGSYYEALTHYVQCGTKAALAEKISSVFTQISAWSREAIYTPLEDFVWMLMSQTGYYSYVGALPGGDQRQANLRTFVDKTLSFREGGSNSIFSLLRYIEAIGKKKIDIGQINLMSEKDDVVRIMTIHKSKGLEFPMVIVSGLGKRFNRDNRSKVGSMHKDIGFALSYVNHKDRWYKTTLLEQIIAAKKAAESLEEEIRVLYVAITRAKDKLVLMAGVNDLADRLEKYDQGVTGKSCFLDLIYPQLEKSQIEVFTHDRNSLGQYIQGSTGKEMVMASLLEDYAKNRNEQLKEQVHHLLSYRYPMEHELGVKSKFSVSELNYVTNQESRLKVALNEPEFTKEKRDFTGVEKGTLMHKVMEHLDFSAVYQHLLKSREEGFSYVSRFILSLVSQELLLPKEAEAIDRNKIMAFFDSPIGIRAAKAEKLYKEKAFNILHDHQGTEIIVQGIIDCYFEEKGELVLLDYKTNYATEEVRETYRAQIDLYKEALEKTEGKPVKEAYLYLFSKGRVEVM
ncbi:MAG: UvrD-helicase domain-containing protein, partial [Anaerovoracaceae bacterium]